MNHSASPRNDETRQRDFVSLLTRFQSDIYLYLRSLVLNPDEAADVLQDTNLVLWEKRDQFQPGTNFRAWAFQIARYKLQQRRARHRRESVGFSDALTELLSLDMAGQDQTFDDLILDLRDCMAKLSPLDRELIGNRYGPDGDCGRVAQSVGRPVRWVYKALNRIRKTLLDCIVDRAESRK